MFENLLAALLTVAATAKAVSFGVWTIKRNNAVGGIFTILLAVAAFALMSIYFAGLFL